MLPDIPEEEPKGFELPGRFSGSRGDISSVSAPYVIPREPEELPPGKPTGERGYWEERDESEEDDPEALSSEEFEEEPGEEEEPLSSDMEEKIASWDAAVKRQLQNPFLRALEGRARQAAKAAEEGRRTGASDRAEPGRRAGTDSRQEKAETGGEVETGRTARRLERAEEEEKLDLQGPAIDPDTGMEYETNTVKHHPTQPDMLLVYDKDEHRWIVQAERAFQNFQINKRTLLGKDYEPPVYLD